MSGKNNRMEHPSLAEAGEGFFVYGIINRTSYKEWLYKTRERKHSPKVKSSTEERKHYSGSERINGRKAPPPAKNEHLLILKQALVLTFPLIRFFHIRHNSKGIRSFLIYIIT